MARVLFLLPALDFDPSEAAVSWQVVVNAGHVVRFATPDGRPAVADDMMLTGRGLDLWGQIPLLRNLPLLGLLMRANRDARQAYAKMIVDPNYVAPQCHRSNGVRRVVFAWRSSCTWYAQLP